VTVRIINGDMLAELPKLAANSLHACVTDPPYELGFMGKKWDSTGIAFRPETWAEVYRVLRPGAYLLAFGAPRNAHRMTCAIEDAGFDIRDDIAHFYDGGLGGPLFWLFGSGFPKSHDVSKALDRKAGAEREVVGSKLGLPGYHLSAHDGGEAFGDGLSSSTYETRLASSQITAPATEEAKRWQGWGSALKPAHEPIIVARKPLDGTIADNVLKWGVGGINIDGCRIEGTFESGWSKSGSKASENLSMSGANYARDPKPDALGRWPANVAHDGSEEVIAAFGDKSSSRANGNPNNPTHGSNGSGNSYKWGDVGRTSVDYRDNGTASRFFFSGKATADDRVGSKHPTVKPTALMRWLVTMVTPPGGTVLDPFAGTGSTLLAADQLGFDAIGIEADATYAEDARRKFVADAGLFTDIRS